MTQTFVLMVLFIVALTISTLSGVKFDNNKNSFMDVDDSTFLRGFWCIIVVLVHIPSTYQNSIQDMIGSFAYIGVTFFFMTSAYGLKYSIEHKEGYMNHFWRRRLTALLIPALIANWLFIAVKVFNNSKISLVSLIDINGWVKVLLLMYFGFWLIYGIVPKLIRGNWQDFAMVLFVIVCSVVTRFSKLKVTSIWIVEPLGFAYGIIAAKYSVIIKKWFSKFWLIKTFLLALLSVALGLMYLKFKPIEIWGDYVLKIVLGISITTFIFCTIAKFKVGNRINSFLGKISYEVYLLHGCVFYVLETVCNDSVNSGMFVLLSVLFTVFLSAILNKVSHCLIRAVSKALG